MRLLALALHRLAWFVPTLLGLLVVTFFISRVIPADPVALVAGETATPAQVEELRRQLGYDRPLPVQFVQYVGRLVRGDMGTSIFTRRPIVGGSRAPVAGHDRADHRRHGLLHRRRHPARRALGALAQLAARPRAARGHGVRPGHRELLAGDHAAAAVRDAAGLDAAQRPPARLSAPLDHRVLSRWTPRSPATGRPSAARCCTWPCPPPRWPSRRWRRSCASPGPACST